MANSGGTHGFAPALTSFVGRADEAGEVAALLATARMVTVAGVGGVGKTRLAAEVARLVVPRFADGAWLVELAALQDGALVPAAVAAAVGLPLDPALPALESLAGALARRQLLLVVDNCEHLLPAAAALCRAVLSAADDVRVLTTSREPLRVAGETTYRLRPFAVPAAPDVTPPGVSDGDAVALFADRAATADPGFRLDDRSGPLVARIVARLDGMPLAIELAAARVEALGLDQLAARVAGGRWPQASGDRAAAPRHQSLTAALDWSYQLLSEAEQRVFRRLAIFPGPFTLDAAVAVAGSRAEPEVEAELEPAVLRLVDCSLLTPPVTGADGRARYLMLETVRSFGRERLAGGGDAEHEATARGLAWYALAVAEQAAGAGRSSTTELAAGRWVDAEDALLSQALAWSLEHDQGIALRLAIALANWRILRGRHVEAHDQLSVAARHATPGTALWSEAQYWLGQTVSARDQTAALAHYRAARDALEPTPGPSAMLAMALAGESNMHLMLGHLDEAVAVAKQALTMARAAGDACAEVYALLDLGQALTFTGDPEGAVGWVRQAGRIDPAAIPGDFARDCWVMLTLSLTEVGELDAARDTGDRLLALARQAGDRVSEAVAWYLLADVAVRAGQRAEAAGLLLTAVRLALEIRHRIQLVVCLPIGAQLCAAAGQWADVVTLYAAHRAARETGGEITENPHFTARREELTGRAGEALTPHELRRASERGAMMTLETAAEFLVMAVERGHEAPQGAAAPPLELSPRERELIALVARGRTDAQIARDLYISINTVRSHLERIRDKTSCRRRADLTRLALDAGLA